MTWPVLVWVVLLGGAPAQAAEPLTFEIGAATLKVAMPELPGLKRDARGDEQLKGWWHGTVGGSDLEIELRVFEREAYWLFDPEDVTEHGESVLRNPEFDGDALFAYAAKEIVPGAFGWVPYASIAFGPLPNQVKPTGEVLVLGGVLEMHAYTVRVRATPPLPKEERATMIAFLRTGITATGPQQDPRWTDKEAHDRWAKSTPDLKVREGLKDLVRTAHYLILTDSGAGGLFAKKMESCYEFIRKTFPFEERPGQRLLLVLLFKTKEEYYAFSKHTGAMEDADTTKGHAWKDYYATYYDSPNDAVHIHEATHQIFINRLRLTGGGTWFQEGVAEYICTKPGERKSFAKQAARSGDFVPFQTFFASKEILAGFGKIDGWQAYLQAASIIEMLREDKRFAPRFLELVHTVGMLARQDVEATEQALRRLYEIDIAGLEAAWKKYWLAK